MKEMLEIIVKNLVDEPEMVFVTETESDKGFLLEVKVSPADMGKVIGKQGKIAKAIRSIVKSAAIHHDKRVVVEIVQ